MAFFKLLAGSHSDGTGDNARKYNWKGPFNIIESDDDLAKVDAKKFAPYSGPVPDYLKKGAKKSQAPKLGNVDSGKKAMQDERAGVGLQEEEENATTTEVEDDGLEEMTITELREHARKRGISLTGLTSKSDIVEKIREDDE